MWYFNSFAKKLTSFLRASNLPCPQLDPSRTLASPLMSPICAVSAVNSIDWLLSHVVISHMPQS